MSYPPNTERWQPGTQVIHRADAKRPEMLMVVQGYHRGTGECRTRYMHPEHLQGMYGMFLNDVRYLLDPAVFGIVQEEGATRL